MYRKLDYNEECFEWGKDFWMTLEILAFCEVSWEHLEDFITIKFAVGKLIKEEKLLFLVVIN